MIQGEQLPQGPLNNWINSDEPGRQGTNLFPRPEAAKVSLARLQGSCFNTGDYFGSRWQLSGPTAGDSSYDRDGRRYYSRQNSSAREEENEFTPDYEKEDSFLSAPRSGRRHYERVEQRTVVAKNLHERTTHKDITDFVRGGTLLDIYLRSNDKTASISFVEGQHAFNFMSYVKRNDIYVHGKRVSGTPHSFWVHR